MLKSFMGPGKTPLVPKRINCDLLPEKCIVKLIPERDYIVIFSGESFFVKSQVKNGFCLKWSEKSFRASLKVSSIHLVKNGSECLLLLGTESGEYCLIKVHESFGEIIDGRVECFDAESGSLEFKAASGDISISAVEG